MDEYQTFLGSAAAGAAAALAGAGSHSPANAKRRASSERRAAAKPIHEADRSRSPGREAVPDVHTEVAARAIIAPLYVEPGADGGSLRIECMHRHNMEKLFGYLAHMEEVANDHADHVDGIVFEQRGVKRAARDTAVDTRR